MPPPDYKYTDLTIAVRSDGSIDQEFSHLLKAEKLVVTHMDQTFCAEVWFDKEWNCDVYRGSRLIHEIQAKTFEAIRENLLEGNECW